MADKPEGSAELKVTGVLRVRVSVSTVSRALSDQPSIAPATRRRIQTIAQEMGYRPNPLLATLMTGIRDRKPPTGANPACLHGETAGTDIFPMHRGPEHHLRRPSLHEHPGPRFSP